MMHDSCMLEEVSDIRSWKPLLTPKTFSIASRKISCLSGSNNMKLTLSCCSMESELCNGSTIHLWDLAAYSFAACTTLSISAMPLMKISRSPLSFAGYWNVKISDLMCDRKIKRRRFYAIQVKAFFHFCLFSRCLGQHASELLFFYLFIISLNTSINQYLTEHERIPFKDSEFICLSTFNTLISLVYIFSGPWCFTY